MQEILYLPEEDLTEKEELYAQMRSQGYTKTEAAKAAYPDQKYPKQQGFEAEKRPRVIARILELREERAEAAGLDVQEQVRRYNDIYRMAMKEGRHALAMKALERLDQIGGFDAPTKNITLSGKLGEALRHPNGNIEADVNRFAKLLQPHHQSQLLIEGDYEVVEPEMAP